MNQQTAPETGSLIVGLRCSDCPAGKREHGSIDFRSGIGSGLFVWSCRRGHMWAIRKLTREERRSNPDHPPFVATRWNDPGSS